MDTDGIPLILLLLLCLATGTFFSLSEMAYTAMNRIRVQNMADSGNRKAKRAMLVSQRFEEALTTSLVGNNIANIGAAAIVTLLATRYFGIGGVAVSTVALTAFIFFFCEMLPKSLARRRAEHIAIGVSDVMLFAIRVLKPVAFVFTAWGNVLKRRFKAPDGPSFTEEELTDIIETIEDEGVLEPEERELVLSAFEFSEKTAEDILTSMEDVVALSLSQRALEIQRVLHENNLSRFPVYDAKRTNVVGMLQANRFYSAKLKGEYRGLRPLLLPLRSFSKDTHIDTLMREMNTRRIHMALILGEDRRPLGIVTMEDILEELVGEIYDEDDEPPPEELATSEPLSESENESQVASAHSPADAGHGASAREGVAQS